jgi:hypothetical protein
MSERVTTLIRSIKSNESITVDGPAQITLGRSRSGRAVMIIRAPETTVIGTRKQVKPDSQTVLVESH